MGYKMKGINSFGEGTPLLQKKTVAGEGTGLVKKDDKGNKYAIYGGRNADLEEYDSGYEDGVNPWTGDPSAMPGDTIFVGDKSHLFGEGNTPAAIHSGWKPGDDDFIMGGEHSIDETKSSKNRKKGPKSYKTTD
tara:strand:- start:1474 stop:1875 length:402 start_codon:yes stop_codon:yes gene_type:complete